MADDADATKDAIIDQEPASMNAIGEAPALELCMPEEGTQPTQRSQGCEQELPATGQERQPETQQRQETESKEVEAEEQVALALPESEESSSLATAADAAAMVEGAQAVANASNDGAASSLPGAGAGEAISSSSLPGASSGVPRTPGGGINMRLMTRQQETPERRFSSSLDFYADESQLLDENGLVMPARRSHGMADASVTVGVAARMGGAATPTYSDEEGASQLGPGGNSSQLAMMCSGRFVASDVAVAAGTTTAAATATMTTATATAVTADKERGGRELTALTAKASVFSQVMQRIQEQAAPGLSAPPSPLRRPDEEDADTPSDARGGQKRDAARYDSAANSDDDDDGSVGRQVARKRKRSRSAIHDDGSSANSASSSDEGDTPRKRRPLTPERVAKPDFVQDEADLSGDDAGDGVDEDDVVATQVGGLVGHTGRMYGRAQALMSLSVRRVSPASVLAPMNLLPIDSCCLVVHASVRALCL